MHRRGAGLLVCESRNEQRETSPALGPLRFEVDSEPAAESLTALGGGALRAVGAARGSYFRHAFSFFAPVRTGGVTYCCRVVPIYPERKESERIRMELQ